MPTEVLMPQMGESIAEGTITRWMVKVGETVERDQPLLEISTDKVDAEIPSPAAGVLTEIRFQEGETVEVDTVIALITKEGEEAEPVTAAPAVAAAGKGKHAEAPAAEDLDLEPVEEEEPAAAAAAGGEVISLKERLRTFSSPLVRRIAAEEGVDLAQVQGTGVQGRVTKGDIMAYLDQRAAGGTATGAAAAEPTAPVAPSRPAASTPAPAGRAPAAPAAPAAPTPFGDFSVPAYGEGERVEIEPMSRIRQLTAAHMLYSQQTSAHVATVFEIDMTRVVALRQRARRGFERQHGTKLTFMPFVFQAVTNGLQAHPKFNASLDGTDIVFKKEINLGMAVALEWGLIVPVIKNADRLSLSGLAQTANDLADRARTKKLKPEEVQGGTFTITNPGVFGSLFGTPLINQPQVAILCVGAIQKRPVVITDDEGNDALAIRSMAYMALSYDHRLIDGADAEQFMLTVKQTLEAGEWSELQAYL